MPDITSGGVSLAVRSLDGRELLEECLPTLEEAIKYHGHPDDEICIVDDGSTDGSYEFIKENHPDIKVWRNEQRTGCPAATNRVVGNCSNDIVILLDNDVKVEKDFIKPILPHFKDPKVFAVTLRSLGFDMKSFQSGGQVGRFRRGFIRAWENYDLNDRENHPRVKERTLDSLYGIGAHVAYRRELFEEMGGWDNIYAPSIWDDTDIGYRARKRGWAIRYEPRSQVYHKWNATLSKITPGDKQAMLSNRNRFIFHWKNVGDADILAIHFFMLFFRLVFGVLTLRKKTLIPFWQAIGILPEILAKRAEEKKQWVLSDRQVMQGPLNVTKEPGVILL